MPFFDWSFTYSWKEHPDEILKQIILRETHLYKRGTLITIAGKGKRKTGTGKSYLALKMAYDTDKWFHIGKVVYNVGELLKALDEIEETNKHQRKNGQVVVIDEAGSLISADKWASVINRAVSYIFQTFRYLRAGVILVMPMKKLLDKRVRTLSETNLVSDVKINPNTGTRVFSFTAYANLYDEFQDKEYRKTLYALHFPTRKVFLAKDIPVRKINDEQLLEEYEKKSRQWKGKIREVLIDEIYAYEKTLKKSFTEQEIEKIVQLINNNDEFFKAIIYKGKIDEDLLAYLIEKEFDMSIRNKNALKTLVKILKKRLFTG